MRHYSFWTINMTNFTVVNKWKWGRILKVYSLLIFFVYCIFSLYMILHENYNCSIVFSNFHFPYNLYLFSIFKFYKLFLNQTVFNWSITLNLTELFVSLKNNLTVKDLNVGWSKIPQLTIQTRSQDIFKRYIKTLCIISALK